MPITTIPYEAVVSDLLRKIQNWWQHYRTVEAKTTLARVCEITLTVEPFWGVDQVLVRTLTPRGTKNWFPVS
jgi:hypothetical protein